MEVLLFIRDWLAATALQIVTLCGGIFIFGLAIHFISQLSFRSLENAFGSKGIYLVAWLGTPLHELSHALFCIIFAHRIAKIEFFNPDPVNGTLGYVYHKWNRRNPWAVLGNFFIGIGPVVIGSMVLLALFYWLIPDGSAAWDSILARFREANQDHSVITYLAILEGSAFAMVKQIFTVANLASWRFWVFIYLSICVASNVRLSVSDIKGAFSGLGCFVLPFFLLNLLGMAFGFSDKKFFPVTASSLGMVYSVCLLALVMALLGLIITYTLAATYYRLRYKHTLKPF